MTRTTGLDPRAPAAAAPHAPGAAPPTDHPAPPGVMPGSAGILRTRGHDRATASIRTMIAGATPHAIVISGPAGIGKTTLALDLAAGLLCDDPDPSARPCRSCRGCRLVERGRHPDVHRLAPAGPGDQIRIGNRDRPEDGTVRRLAADLVLMAVEGGPRIAIIERADRLTDDAQTALLKTLEEPPAGVSILLCADDEDRLLPTVRSRSARIRLGPVGVREIEAILADAGAAEPPLAGRLARIAAGRPGAAATLARAPEALAARDEIARLLLDLLTAPVAARLAAVRDLTKLATTAARALDRAAVDEPVPGGASPPKRGRGRASPPAAIGPVTVPQAATTGPADESTDDDSTADAGEAAAGSKTAVPAAERRRAAIVLVGLWRELTRDLLVALLGEERQVRDPGLLDDLRMAVDSLAPSGPSRSAGSSGLSASDLGARHVDATTVATAKAARPLGAFLGRLDLAGELLEANVRPELVLDSLLLRWPRPTTR